jgi:hypothetical protein
VCGNGSELRGLIPPALTTIGRRGDSQGQADNDIHGEDAFKHHRRTLVDAFLLLAILAELAFIETLLLLNATRLWDESKDRRTLRELRNRAI